MEPAGKKPPRKRAPARAVVRKLRFHPAHDRGPKPPHYLAGKDRPGEC